MRESRRAGYLEVGRKGLRIFCSRSILQKTRSPPPLSAAGKAAEKLPRLSRSHGAAYSHKTSALSPGKERPVPRIITATPARAAAVARVAAPAPPALVALLAWPAWLARLVRLALLALTVLLAQGCAPKRVLGLYPAEIGSATGGDPQATGLGRASGDEAARGEAVARGARALVGAAYRVGGDTPEGGFDCSGFVRHVCLGQGVRLPRQTRDQAGAGRPVAPGGLSPGDLVFFNVRGRGVSHVGIWIGEGRFVHAPKVGQSVRVERLDDPYWSTRFVGGRRP